MAISTLLFTSAALGFRYAGQECLAVQKRVRSIRTPDDPLEFELRQ